MGAQAPEIPLWVAERPGLLEGDLTLLSSARLLPRAARGAAGGSTAKLARSSPPLLRYCLKLGRGGEETSKAKSVKLPNLFIAAVQCPSCVQRLSLLGKVPTLGGSARVAGGLQGLRHEAVNSQRFFKGLWQSSTSICHIVGLHLAFLMCMEIKEMGREDSLALCFQKCLHFHACRQGSGWERQRLSMGATGLVHTAVPRLASAHMELIFSSAMVCVGWHKIWQEEVSLTFLLLPGKQCPP